MRSMKTIQRIACAIALAFVAVLVVSTPRTVFADSIDTSTPGVKVSVFSADGNADTSRFLTDNPQHSGHQTPVPGQYGEIVVRVGQTIRDTGSYSHYTTTRPGFAPFGVTTTLVTAGAYPELPATDYDFTHAFYGNSNTVTNNGGQFYFEFTGRRVTPANQPVTAFFLVTMQGDSSDPANVGGNTTHLMWVGYHIHVIPAETTPTPTPTPTPSAVNQLIYDANGGTIYGNATYTESKTPNNPRSYGFADYNIIEDLPVRDGYKFEFWKRSYVDNHFRYVGASAVPADANNNPAGDKRYVSQTTVFNMRSPYTLTAVWNQEYELSYDANGGTGAPAAQSGYFGIDSNTADSLTDPKNETVSSTVPTRDGYIFKGWKLDGTTYQAGDQVTLTTTNPKVVLVAEWEPEPVAPVTPENPATPENPGTPGNPGTPSVPGNLGDPLAPSFPGAPNPAAFPYYGGTALPYTGDENHALSALVIACVAGGVIALAVVARAKNRQASSTN